jgi:preprotein translocase subunit SecG
VVAILFAAIVVVVVVVAILIQRSQFANTRHSHRRKSPESAGC